MPILRNPFRKPAGELQVQDENQKDGAERSRNSSENDISVPVEYKLSEIDDSGVFIPPSPTETKSFWSTRSTTSTTASNHRSVLNENEPFNISRESFDSYRRSFDISARSPVCSDMHSTPPRQSLDSRRIYQPRASSSYSRPSIDKPELKQVEEHFKEVDLNDDAKPKRRGIFSRFGGDSDAPSHAQNENSRPTSSHHFGINFTGRKRGQSGQGAELRSMPRGENPMTTHTTPEIKVDS